jgi:hypothetical protein
LIGAKVKQAAIIAIDCAPNGQLNVLGYQDGTAAAKKLIILGKSFLEDNGKSISHLIARVEQDKPLVTNFSLGESLGLWHRIRPNDWEMIIDWQKPFVVKNENGKTKIWHPDWRLYRRQFRDNGFATKTAIVRFIRENKAYWQNWYNPLANLTNDPSWRIIFRLLFSGGNDQKPEFLGGLWIGRHACKVYPGSDAIIGLVKPSNLVS